MKYLILLLLFIVSLQGYSQTYAFNHFNNQNGLAQDFVYSINQTNEGNLVIGTGDGISIFDGLEFINHSSKSGLNENTITCSYKASNGDIIFGHNEGSITLFQKGQFLPSKKTIESSSTVVGICMIEDEIIYCTQNDGIFLVNAKNQIKKIYSKKDILFKNILAIKDNILLVGTNDGILELEWKKGELSLVSNLSKGDIVNTIVELKSINKIIVAIETKGLFSYSKKNNNSTLTKYRTPIDEELISSEISSILIDNNKAIWIGTINNGLFQINRNSFSKNEDVIHFHKKNGLGSDFVKCLYQDHEGNVWVGTFGNGISRPLENYFVFFPKLENDEGFNAFSFAQTTEGTWVGLTKGILLTKNDKSTVFFNSNNGFINERVSVLKGDKNDLWIGTDHSGVYYYSNKNKSFSKINLGLNGLESYINDIEVESETIWFATQGGLISYNVQTKEVSKFGTESGLPHNYIASLCSDNDHNLFIGTQGNALLKLTNGELTEVKLVERGIINIIDLFSDYDNNIWMATAENGVIKYNKDTTVFYNVMNGLKSNYCYAINADNKNNVWVGHSNGLSKILPYQIKTFDYKDGISGRVNSRAIFKGNKGLLWIGTSEELIQYNSSKEIRNIIPPIVSILKVEINDKPVDFSKPINLPYGKYKIHIEFKGISLSHPEFVKYKFKLVGFDEEFSVLTGNSFTTYGKVSSGEYHFELLACNANGVFSKPNIWFQLNIDLPFYEKLFFQIIILIAVIIIVLVILRVRTYSLKRRQLQLEEEIDAKTVEITKQKDKIENINKDLTDSINYAEKIQKRIMPDYQDLTNKFPGSFVYFSPKDVVSGDFYYFHETDEKFIIAVGDCTGHGVPGAFMTFIGKMSLRNIFANSLNNELSPSEILKELDNEVELILNQKNQDESDDFYKSRDGMDIVICEINKKNLSVKIASAMRPVIVNRGDSIEIIKGSRYSIGGGFSNNKLFDLNHIQLKKGDKIYLFTDGVSDQFGGPENKKLKIDGIIEILSLINTKDSSENYKITKSLFKIWQGENRQIDDVLLVTILI